MIKKDAVEAFLKRDLDNHDWIKNCSHEELDDAIKELGFKSRLGLTPRLHQKATFYLCANTDSFLMHLSMGTGKTYISVMLYDYFRAKRNRNLKMLAVVPNTVNIKNWEEQINDFSPFKPVMLYGTLAERQAKLKEPGDIYIINYEGLQVLMADLQQVKGKKNKARVYNPELAKGFVDKFDMVVFDEVHKVKNSQSLTFQLCKKIADNTPLRYGLTGTPLSKNSQDLWSQFFLIDRGETLGSSITLFRQAFYSSKPGYFGGMDFVLDKKKEPILSRFIKNKSIHYKDSECGDLPKQIFIKKYVDFTPQALKEMNTLRKQAKEIVKDGGLGTNLYIKGRQISSGFVYEKVSETDRIALRFPNNPKLDELQELLEDMPDDKKIVIFFSFEESGIMIKERLAKMKVKFNVGGGKDAIAEYEDFKKNKKSKAFVINIASGSTGLNLQNASFCLYYEPSDNVITYQQSLKRIHREGQVESRVYYYFFITENSVEEKIYQSLQEGIDIAKSLIEGKVKIEDIL